MDQAGRLATLDDLTRGDLRDYLGELLGVAGAELEKEVLESFEDLVRRAGGPAGAARRGYSGLSAYDRDLLQARWAKRRRERLQLEEDRGRC